MSRLPTAEEQLREYNLHLHTCCDNRTYHAMREFARLHVKAALEAAAENARAKEDPDDYGTGEIWVDQDSILSAYSEKNIL